MPIRTCHTWPMRPAKRSDNQLLVEALDGAIGPKFHSIK